jgi:gliding motility-associated-like protein
MVYMLFRPVIIVLIGVIFPISPLGAQLCPGNLGENIFSEGDFGSGVTNVLPYDPLIAPGYQYQSVPPPNDGYYSIANNTTPWGSFAYDAWVNTGDNSPDPQGYMMVVNASYTPGLFYLQEVDGLCENTLYVFSADIINLIRPGRNAIKPNVSFLLDGEVYYNTGEIAENGEWNTYGFTFVTGPGQTTLTLSLRNNAPGGLGNDLALDNISFRACGDEAFILPETVANICEDGEPIPLEATLVGDLYNTPYVQWQLSRDDGMTWADIPGATGMIYQHTDLTGGMYRYRFLLANGPANLLNPKCRVVSNEKVVNVIPKFYTIIDTLCEGLSFQLGDQWLDKPGTYTDTLQNFIGCDSIVTVHLDYWPDEHIRADFDVVHPSCDYLSDGSVHIKEIYNGLPPFELFVNGLSSSTGSMQNQAGGGISYRITDRFGCRLDTVIDLVDPPPFAVNLGDDLIVRLGDRVDLDPWESEAVGSYGWHPAEQLDCSVNCDRVSLYPPASLTVVLEAYSEAANCYATDTVQIVVRTARRIYFPNAFSPNFDGLNDYFTVMGDVPNVQLIEVMKIYDRWGNLVFENRGFPPNDKFRGWNGTYRDHQAEPGVYVYFVRVRFLDGEVLDYGGDVTLVR